MKKAILILSLIAGILVSSCSKSDDASKNANENLEPNANNIKGIWYYRGDIKGDGTMLPHQNECSAKRDYIHVDFDGITDGFYDADCLFHNDSHYFTGQSFGYHLIFNDFTEDKYITKLTVNEFHLTYAAELSGEIITKVYTRN